jgi:Uncharacterized conserved protein (DUF2075)
MHFRDANLVTSEPPIERVAVFDEAQRAWDAKHLANFMNQKKGQTDFRLSEPEFLISVMDRHDGWCAVICLVGGGQEINAGEAGLTEWFPALKRSFRGWKVYTSEQLAHRDYHWGQDLADQLQGLDFRSLPALHLAVSVRSFRAEKLPISETAAITFPPPHCPLEFCTDPQRNPEKRRSKYVGYLGSRGPPIRFMGQRTPAPTSLRQSLRGSPTRRGPPADRARGLSAGNCPGASTRVMVAASDHLLCG